ncbi:MAG: phage integrase N-terminal SAM-like domain-containing protein [Gammaproteobacteria bacterium]|nr:phage integrase N-terminal SAM-like domain-containing protein [Gammaproteobacteria bacterium]
MVREVNQNLQLNGKGERTQEAYTRTIRMLVEFYHKTPDLITEENLQHYFLHRRSRPVVTSHFTDLL